MNKKQRLSKANLYVIADKKICRDKISVAAGFSLRNGTYAYMGGYHFKT